MRFLVKGEGRDIGGQSDPREFSGMLERVIVPSLQMLEKWEKEGKFIGGHPAGRRASVYITEAPSVEELTKTLAKLPFHRLINWEIIPLVTSTVQLEAVQEQINATKHMVTA
jgi:muconolactone delta-isomerase